MSVPNQEESSLTQNPISDVTIIRQDCGWNYPADLSQYVTDESTFRQLVDQVNICSRNHNVPVEIIWTVLYMESKYDINSRRGSSGEYGIAQILKDGMDCKHGYDLTDWTQNVDCACNILEVAIERNYTPKEIFNWYNSGSRYAGYGRTAVNIYEGMLDNNIVVNEWEVKE